MKSEPKECSVDDALAAPNATVAWVGVRNYQARNFMRDSMQLGDGVLFYHSSCAEPGIVGIARVASAPCPDPTQFDIQSPYYDAASMVDAPRWHLVDIQVVRKIPLLALSALRCRPELIEMLVLRKSNRLSVMPVDELHWTAITGNKIGL